MGLLGRRDDHVWSQEHLSHYVEGDLGWWARRRLQLHAEDCPDCSRGIRAIRALMRLMHTAANASETHMPDGVFDLVRAEATGSEDGVERVDGT